MAFFVVWRQNRAAKQLTSLQLFLQLAAQWDSADMHRNRAQPARRLLADRSALDLDDTALVFLETLAHMSRRKLIDRDLIWTTFSMDVSSYWAVVRHYVKHVRDQFSDPTLFEELEMLNGSFAADDRMLRDAPISVIGITEDALKYFLHWESRRGDPLAPTPPPQLI